MRTRRRFQPALDGLPYRIAPPSTAADVIPARDCTPASSGRGHDDSV